MRITKSFWKRTGWLFLALLFVGTGLGVGVVAFLQNIHKDKAAQNQTAKLKGAKLPNFTPVAHVDSLQTTDTKVGTGAEVKPGATVTVHYTGAVAATGTIFESSIDTGQPLSIALDQVIKGWGQGVPGMKVNGQRRLLIPANLAYGLTPPPGSGIPANADLVFDIILLDTK